jgi:hypothetical protein
VNLHSKYAGSDYMTKNVFLKKIDMN